MEILAKVDKKLISTGRVPLYCNTKFLVINDLFVDLYENSDIPVFLDGVIYWDGKI